MTMYIRSAACVSPAFRLEDGVADVRKAIGESGRKAVGGSRKAAGGGAEKQNGRRPAADSLRLVAREPDYSQYVDAKMIRRMSRIVKMGVSAAMRCLQNGGSPVPGALITGTAYGCLEDTGIFLRKMITNNEELLSPTAFIQSTHNTVGAQVALLLKCHSYNNTIVHRAFSLEHSLTEAEMLLKEEMGPVLVGAIDEITKDSFDLLNRFDLIGGRQAATGGLRFPMGEGAAFFLLQREPTGEVLAGIDHVATRREPGITAGETANWVQAEIRSAGIDPGSIGTVLNGSNGLLKQSSGPVFSNATFIDYKSLCGEFPTAAGFALWLAAVLCGGAEPPSATRSVLIFNQTADGHNSLILVSPC